MANLPNEIQEQELETVKNQLQVLGVDYPQNAKLSTLRGLLVKHVNGIQETEVVKKDAQTEDVMTKLLTKVRCSIVCRNPDKASLKGEHVTCGNSAVGHHTFFVPYNCDAAEDYYLPRIVIETLKGKSYIDTFEKPNKIGESLVGFQNGTRYIPEFMITELSEDMPETREVNLLM